MTSDTELFRALAAEISGRICFLPLKTPALESRHESIMAGLEGLAAFFLEAAEQAEAEESVLASLVESLQESEPVFTGDFSFTPDVEKLLRRDGDSSSLDFSGSMSLGRGSASWAGQNSLLELSASVGTARVRGSATAALFKEGRFDPEIGAKASLEGSMASGEAYARVGTDTIYGDLRAHADIGKVYGKAELNASLREQVVECKVGAAAVSGEAETAINFGRYRVGLTGSASLGSCEWGFSFRHINGEWQVGAKLGFIAGLGFELRFGQNTLYEKEARKKTFGASKTPAS